MSTDRHYININPAWHNFDFGNDSSVTLFGIGGQRIYNNSHCKQREHQISNVIPSHIIVHLWGNDLDNEELSEEFADETVLNIISYCGMLKKWVGGGC
jgi:hypothetical protein